MGDESGGDRSGQPDAGIAAGRRTEAGGSLVGIVGVQGAGLVDGVGEAAGVHVGSAVGAGEDGSVVGEDEEAADALAEGDGAPGAGAPVSGVAVGETPWSRGVSTTIGVPSGSPARGPAPSGEVDAGTVGETEG
ncbi:hypothetical protein BL253_05640 [Pseudofrankia asymbiotica]|uniref:Uncharacterized protein n=1 Tax=Pseudofrankia asymbiotica TaxID=1834516 RepID=A0A1V2IIB5_9ACTN|nr:hypothetical protein BL253_05640 [Pseudofrankia asymbiotica]